MSEHPAARCTPHQRATFERIAIGDDSRVSGRTADLLIDCGLIERYGEARGMFTIHRYRVPIPVHAQWCQWCAENVTLPSTPSQEGRAA